MKTMNTRKFVYNCLFIALFVVCSFLSTPGNIKITLQNLPLYLGAMLLGPMSGALIGFCGMLISQLITYGFDVTTILWLLPHTIIGFIVGKSISSGKLVIRNDIKFTGAIVTFQLILTVLNTIVLIIDAVVKLYFKPILILAPFIARIMVGIMIGIVYGLILPNIYKIIKKIHQPYEANS